MGTLTNEMARLASEVVAMRDKRSSFVVNLRNSVGKMQQEFQQTRQRLAEKTRSDLSGFVRSITSFADDLENKVMKLREEYRNGQGEKTAALRNGLSKFASQLRRSTSQLLKNFQESRSEMTEKIRADLGAFISDLELEVRDLIKNFSRERADMAEKTHTDLDNFIDRLTGAVAEIRAGAASIVQGFADDLRTAHLAWTRLSRARTVSRHPEQDRLPGRAPKFAKARIPDDLTAIPGIGAKMRKSLYDMGVKTFAQLAAKDPDQLRRDLGGAGRAALIKKWIARAQKRANSSK